MATAGDAIALRMQCAHLEDRAAIARVAFELARDMGFERRACWEIGIVVQELVSNIVRHARSGYLELDPHPEYLDVTAVDAGPGIPSSVILASETSQHGLGAIRRLMHKIEISSPAQGGTRILARRELGRRL